MGLDLRRVPPNEWLYWAFSADDRRRALEVLRQVASVPLDDEPWIRSPAARMSDFPDPYPEQRVGSYTAYGVFILVLQELTTGVDESHFEQNEDIERNALRAFRDAYPRLRVGIPMAIHFLAMPDSEGAFVPVDFEAPLEIAGESIASLPAALRCLTEFARATSFSLTADFEEQYSGEEWIPLGTTRNVARILYRFMSADPRMVTMFT